MKTLNTIFLFLAALTLNNCNKIKKEMKEHTPDYSYKNAGIDKFYYVRKDLGDTPIIPLIKPYNISSIGNPKEWFLDTFVGKLQNDLGGGISPILQFNCHGIYIYGYKPFEKDEEDSSFDSPEKWFIINTQKKELVYFDKEADFKTELKRLNLPEDFLNPDEVYEQYKENPILPWFPEDIKKQLKEVKSRQEK